MIFIHIPKNAGLTISHPSSPLSSNLLAAENDDILPADYVARLQRVYSESPPAPSGGKHHARWRDIDPSVTASEKAFAVVRNPWSRVVSRFVYGKQIRSFDQDLTFEQFVDTRLDDSSTFSWHRAVLSWHPQLEYVSDLSGNIRCDILRFERFGDEVKAYFSIDEMPEPINVTTHEDYREFYTPELRDVVGEWYQEDVETFGFSFDGTATKNCYYGEGAEAPSD